IRFMSLPPPASVAYLLLVRCHEGKTYLNNGDCLGSDRDGSHVISDNDEGIEQPDGERCHEAKPTPATGSVRDALCGLTCDDHKWRGDAKGPELGAASLRDLECDWVRDRLCYVFHQDSNDPRNCVIPDCRRFTFPSKV